MPLRVQIEPFSFTGCEYHAKKNDHRLIIRLYNHGRIAVHVLTGCAGKIHGTRFAIRRSASAGERMKPNENTVVIASARADIGDLAALLESRGFDVSVRGGLAEADIESLADGGRVIIDNAILKKLHRELLTLRSELAERKVIERAKGLLMKQRGISEEDAYRALQRQAMDKKRKIADVARSVIESADLFHKII